MRISEIFFSFLAGAKLYALSFYIMKMRRSGSMVVAGARGKSELHVSFFNYPRAGVCMALYTRIQSNTLRAYYLGREKGAKKIETNIIKYKFLNFEKIFGQYNNSGARVDNFSVGKVYVCIGERSTSRTREREREFAIVRWSGALRRGIRFWRLDT